MARWLASIDRSVGRRRDLPWKVVVASLLVCVAGLLGCRPAGLKTVPVSGAVLYRGQPIAGARVTFRCESSPRSAVGTTSAEGEFALSTMGAKDGAVAGVHQVTILTLTPEAIAKMSNAEQEALGRGESVPGSTLPTRYASFEKSPLSATVEAGKKNYFRFDLTD